MINASQNSSVNETWVSTEDKKIKQLSKDFDCNVIDSLPKWQLIIAKVKRHLFTLRRIYIWYYCIYPAYISLIDIWWYWWRIELNIKKWFSFSGYKDIGCRDGEKENLKPLRWDVNKRPFRQEKDYKFVENGAFYITTRDRLLSSQLRYSGKMNI